MILLTEASQQALNGLRDFTLMKWYVVPLLSIVMYIYFTEVKKARQTGDWNAIYAGLTLFGMDFINETWNGWILATTQHSAFWTTPGDTGLRVMVGWNIEIIFMFLMAGIVFYNSLPDDPSKKILGIPNRWFLAIFFTIFCVFVECILNIGNLLVWEYLFWNLSITGIWLIFLIGYFPFFAAIILVIQMKDDKKKKFTIGIIYLIAIVMNIIGFIILGFIY